MNRNVMYDYLRDKGMKVLYRWRENSKKYYVEFTLNQEEDQTDCIIEFDWGYVRHVRSISLCQEEIVIEPRLSDMKINVYYRDIKQFDVRIKYD